MKKEFWLLLNYIIIILICLTLLVIVVLYYCRISHDDSHIFVENVHGELYINKNKCRY